MKVEDILTMFKIQGQSKGLDSMRFISNEDIAVYINQAIVNKVRATVMQNAQSKFTDKVSMQDNPLASTNILRNLLMYQDVSVEDTLFGSKSGNIDLDVKVMYYTSFDAVYEHEVVSCRVVDYDKFYQHRNDYCNQASWRTPIITYLYNNNNLRILVEYKSKAFPTSRELKTVRVAFVKQPDDFTVDDLTFDYTELPDYVIPEIVEIAVNTYFRSIGATSQQVSQQQEQNNQ